MVKKHRFAALKLPRKSPRSINVGNPESAENSATTPELEESDLSFSKRGSESVSGVLPSYSRVVRERD